MNIGKEVRDCLISLRISSRDARRRKVGDEEMLDELMDPYVVDSDVKIPGSKSFRRLPYKTQVFTGPRNVLVRNRLSHTEEVKSMAVRVASILGLNVNLTRAIAATHDIGHVPLGHTGEIFLSSVMDKKFRHEVFGAVLLQKIERKGEGVNATHQTLSGVRYHSRGKGKLTVCKEMSQEAVVVMYSDKFAYTTSDYNDISKRLNLPESWIRPVTLKINELGGNQRKREDTLIEALCADSFKLGRVGFVDSKVEEIFTEVKDLMYEIYPKICINQPEESLDKIFCYLKNLFGKDKAMLVFALMTDTDILPLMKKRVFDITDLELTSIWEQKDYLLNLPPVDMCDPDLDW